MSDTLKSPFTMVGSDDAAVCIDGVCELPPAPSAYAAAAAAAADAGTAADDASDAGTDAGTHAGTEKDSAVRNG